MTAGSTDRLLTGCFRRWQAGVSKLDSEDFLRGLDLNLNASEQAVQMISNTIEQLKGGNMPQRHQVTTGLLAVIFVITIMFLPVPAAAKRVALVIGNSAYEHVEPLRNPGRDAEAVASMFDSLGFDVIRGMDLDQQAFAQTLQEVEQANAVHVGLARATQGIAQGDRADDLTVR